MKSDYELLKDYGHSPMKAAEIALDASRGDTWAIQWLEYVREREQTDAQRSS